MFSDCGPRDTQVLAGIVSFDHLRRHPPERLPGHRRGQPGGGGKPDLGSEGESRREETQEAAEVREGSWRAEGGQLLRRVQETRISQGVDSGIVLID